MAIAAGMGAAAGTGITTTIITTTIKGTRRRGMNASYRSPAP
jgi:hypothetical protein